jgi:predicted PurR-regulated permease PerM
VNPGRAGGATSPLPPRSGAARRGQPRPSLGTSPIHLPVRTQPEVRSRSWLAWSIGGAVLVFGVLYVTRSVLTILSVSAVFAWLLDRPVSLLAARGLSREAAIVAVAAGLTVALAVLLVGILPSAVAQLAELGANIQPYLHNAATRFGPLVEEVERRFKIDLPVDFQELGKLAPTYLKLLSPDVQERLQAAAKSAASGGLSVVFSVLSLSLLPLFTFFILRDWPKLLGATDGLVPIVARPVVRRLAAEIDERLIGWVRGQLTVALVLGCVYSAGLMISGIDLAATVGLLGGALFLVPYVGPLVTGVLAGTLCILKFGLDWHLAAVVATFVVGQALEGTVLTPWLVGDRVGLHPLVVMVAVIVGGNVLGIIGIVVAVPLTAALAVVGIWLLGEWRESRTFRGG